MKKYLIKVFVMIMSVTSIIVISSIPASAYQYLSSHTNSNHAFSSSWQENVLWKPYSTFTAYGYYGYDTHLVNQDYATFYCPDYYHATVVINSRGRFKNTGIGSSNVQTWARHGGTHVSYFMVADGSSTAINNF